MSRLRHEVMIRQCASWGAGSWGFTDDVRALCAAVEAELPHRIANAPLQRSTGRVLSSREAQSLIDSTVWGALFFPCALVLFVGFKGRSGQYIGWYSGVQARLHARA